jgi:hypothetical protein
MNRGMLPVSQMLAAKAYDCYNAELQDVGLAINVPETIWHVPKGEVCAPPGPPPHSPPLQPFLALHS